MAFPSNFKQVHFKGAGKNRSMTTIQCQDYPQMQSQKEQQLLNLKRRHNHHPLPGMGTC